MTAVTASRLIEQAFAQHDVVAPLAEVDRQAFEGAAFSFRECHGRSGCS